MWKYKKTKLMLIIVAIMFSLMLFYQLSDVIGWLLLLLTVFLPFFLEDLRANIKMLVAYYIFIIPKHSIAFINSYITTVIGANDDSLRFLLEAKMKSENNLISFNIGADVYTSFLAIFFKMFGYSSFLASELSIVTFILSTIILIKISKLITGETNAGFILIILSIMPAILIYTSIPMREAYQFLFFNLMIFYMIKYYFFKKYRYLMFMMLSSLILATTHNGLLIGSLLIVGILFISVFNGKKYTFSLGIRFLIGLIFIISFSAFFILLNKLGFSTKSSSALLEGEILNYAGGYVPNINTGRSSYNVRLVTDTPLNMMITFPQVLFHYMMAPFPWQIRNLLDVIALFENTLRNTLIIFSIYYLSLVKNNKKVLLLIFSSALILETIWSTGTINWGTAMRHHIVSYGIFIILGISGIKNFFRKRT